MIHSFRTRITGANTLAVALLLALAFGIIYGVVWRSSYMHLDEDLRAEGAEAENNLDWLGDSLLVRKMPEWEEAEHQQLEANPTFIQIVSTEGHILFKSVNLQGERFAFVADCRQPVFFNGVVHEQRLRFGQFPLANQGGDIQAYLTIAVSREEAHLVLHNLRWTLGLTYIMVVVCLFLLLWYAASLAIHPVRRLIRDAQQLDEKDLSARLPASPDIVEMLQLTEAINELLARLETGVQQQQQFIADISHELRTPLTAIKGTIEVLLRKERSVDQYVTKLHQLLAQTNRLHGLYDHMLTLARVEADSFPVRREEVNLTACLEKVRINVAPLLSEMGQHLEIVVPAQAQVYTDSVLLQLALNNLLMNAIKFNKPQGCVQIEWVAETCTLTVTDQGVGIAAAHLPRIFDRFYRADSARSTEIPGYGIGLSIVKKICDAQHIALEVQSIVGEGTTFSLRFPS